MVVQNEQFKEKIYIYGAGAVFRKKEKSVLEMYNILSIIDNYKEGKINLVNGESVPIVKIDQIDSAIPIVIMRGDFHAAWKELQALHVKNRIIFSYALLPKLREEELLFSKGECVDLDKQGRYIYISFSHNYYIIEEFINMQDWIHTVQKKEYPGDFILEASVEPLNREFGFSRGTPIDRYYIEKWLEQNKSFVKGDVFEIAENTYTLRYGEDRINQSYMLHVEENQAPFIKANLETGEGLPENVADCFILTQTLGFIYDFEKVLDNLYKILKPGGVALITTGGISQISRYDMDRWGHYWMFTSAAIKRMIECSKFGTEYTIETFGNVKAACSLLYGLSAEELTVAELDYKDVDYPVCICAICKK